MGIDISNHQRNINLQDLEQLWEMGFRFLIVGVHDYETALRQLKLGQQVGYELAVYRFIYFGRDVGEWVKTGLDYYNRFQDEGLNLKCFWLDAEPDKGLPDIPARQITEELYTAIAWCLEYRVPHGIYSAKWAWERLRLPSGEFNYLPLWDADYDGIARIRKVNYGGWIDPVMKQYYGSVPVRNGLAVDYNVRLK